MKDAYYFSHDSNARHDPRIIKLRRQYGAEGYGVFFMLVEILREQDDYTLDFNDESIMDIAYESQVDEKKVNDIICNYELFTIETNHFYSASLKRRMERADLIREKRSYAGRMSGKARTSVEQVLKQKTTDVEQERKVKEKKRKESKESKSKVLEVKKQEFFTSVHKYSDFSKTMRDDFISYWTELNHSRTKMKWQLQKTFEIKRRLTTWKNNNFNNGKKNGYVSDADYDQQKKDARNREENKKLKELNKHIWD